MSELYQTIGPVANFSPAKPRKLLDQLRDVLRAKHYGAPLTTTFEDNFV